MADWNHHCRPLITNKCCGVYSWFSSILPSQMCTHLRELVQINMWKQDLIITQQRVWIEMVLLFLVCVRAHNTHWSSDSQDYNSFQRQWCHQPHTKATLLLTRWRWALFRAGTGNTKTHRANSFKCRHVKSISPKKIFIVQKISNECSMRVRLRTCRCVDLKFAIERNKSNY